MNQIIGDIVTAQDITWLHKDTIGGINTQSEEEREMNTELRKTVEQFVADFEKMIIVLCGFEHEDPTKRLLFEKCSRRALNLCCGHPRILLLRIEIAFRILKINNHNNYSQLQRDYNGSTAPIGGMIYGLASIDAQAASHYAGKITLGESLAASQKRIGETIQAFRNRLCAAVRSVMV